MRCAPPAHTSLLATPRDSDDLPDHTKPMAWQLDRPLAGASWARTCVAP